MAADLHIHIYQDITEEDLAAAFSNVFGSKHLNPRPIGELGDSHWEALGRVIDTPNIWVGEVSWLKAMITGDKYAFVPVTVDMIHTVIGEDLPLIDADLINRISDAFELGNITGYSLADRDSVVEFVASHVGKRCFTISH